jgi:hypothetical protein
MYYLVFTLGMFVSPSEKEYIRALFEQQKTLCDENTYFSYRETWYGTFIAQSDNYNFLLSLFFDIPGKYRIIGNPLLFKDLDQNVDRDKVHNKE